MVSEDDHNPLHHTQKMKARIDEMISHLREDVENIDEPQFKAMFETAAEVLEGLKTAFAHYEQRSEKAWR
ncbi:hypothetical protein J2W42_003015 [Rhizobium tibeticum]|uniref:hypothetical protein n=1 Tax=Rhizobium tibeticum TaxID=501024 RepID=UPI00277E75FF|nr:hypothetical protein [Rhizobium tibeticum]MDP9810154.1 hypothetical protein [Rhizobium tibeticum]